MLKLIKKSSTQIFFCCVDPTAIDAAATPVLLQRFLIWEAFPIFAAFSLCCTLIFPGGGSAMPLAAAAAMARLAFLCLIPHALHSDCPKKKKTNKQTNKVSDQEFVRNIYDTYPYIYFLFYLIKTLTTYKKLKNNISYSNNGNIKIVVKSNSINLCFVTTSSLILSRKSCVYMLSLKSIFLITGENIRTLGPRGPLLQRGVLVVLQSAQTLTGLLL